MSMNWFPGQRIVCIKKPQQGAEDWSRIEIGSLYTISGVSLCLLAAIFQQPCVDLSLEGYAADDRYCSGYFKPVEPKSETLADLRKLQNPTPADVRKIKEPETV